MKTEELIIEANKILKKHPCPLHMDLKSYREGIYFGVIALESQLKESKNQLKKEREANIKRIKGYVSILDKTTSGNVAHNRSVLKCSMNAAISNIEYRLTQNQSNDEVCN